MVPARLTLAALALATTAALHHPTPAEARHDGWTVHVQGRRGSGGSQIDLAVPWSSDEHGDLFNFCGDDRDDLDMRRLRAVWTELGRLPEGREVTIETDGDPVRARRELGFLVLQPAPRDGREHARIEIPEYVVTATLDRGGHLTDADIARLVHDYGKVTLVRIRSRLGDLKVWIDGTGGAD